MIGTRGKAQGHLEEDQGHHKLKDCIQEVAPPCIKSLTPQLINKVQYGDSLEQMVLSIMVKENSLKGMDIFFKVSGIYLSILGTLSDPQNWEFL